MLVQVKSTLDPDDDFQGVSQLIALDLLADAPVLALLTDLNRQWRFFWVADVDGDHAVVHKATIESPGDAFATMRSYLTMPPNVVKHGEAVPDVYPSIKRRKLDHLHSTGGGINSSLREIIERYYDVASVLGPDIDLAREVARQLVRSIPGFPMGG